MTDSIAVIKAFGSCVSCPSFPFGKEKRKKDCVFKDQSNLSKPEMIKSLHDLKADEIIKLNSECKECCTRIFQQLR